MIDVQTLMAGFADGSVTSTTNQDPANQDDEGKDIAGPPAFSQSLKGRESHDAGATVSRITG